MAIRFTSASHSIEQTTNAPAKMAEPRSAAKSGRKRLRSLAKRLLAVGCLGIGLVGITGCAGGSFHRSECIDDFMIGYRNRALAEKAWHCQREHFGENPYSAAFKDGFIAGFVEVASGGPGCCPAIAPAQYWGWRYQSAQGQNAVNAWFEGYPMGVQAAEQAGLGHTSMIRTAGHLNATPSALAPAIPGDASYPSDAPYPADTPYPVEDPEVTNPFYSEQELIPEPEEIDAGDAEAEAGVPPGDIEIMEPDAVFNSATPESPLVDSPSDADTDLVNRGTLAESHEAAVSATLGDRFEALTDPAEAVTKPAEVVTKPAEVVTEEVVEIEEMVGDEIEEVVVDDIFGSPTTPVRVGDDLEDLPFTFE